MFRMLVLLLCCGSLCAAETPEAPWRTYARVADVSSPVAGARGEPPIHRATFALSGDDPDTPGAPSGDGRRDRGPVAWLVAGGLAFLLVGAIAATAGDDIDALGPDERPPDPPPGVPGSPDPGFVAGDPGERTPSPSRSDELSPPRGLFLSVGTRRDVKRRTGRSRAFHEDGESLSLGYDRRLSGTVDAGLAIDLERAAATFDGSDNRRDRRAGTALFFADYRFRPGSRVSAYTGLALSASDSLRFSDGRELRAVGDLVDGGATDDGGAIESRPIRSEATVRDALFGVSLGHELPLFATVQTTLRLNADYVLSLLDDYAESGDTSFELRFDERVRESLAARVGVELTRAVGTSRGVVLPRAGVDWIHESRDDPRRIVGLLQDDPSLGTTALSDEPDRGHGIVYLDVSLIAPNGLQLFAAAETTFAHEFRRSSTASIGARLELR